MRFVKQSMALPIRNFDQNTENGPKRHSEILPNTIRSIICGPSNCGKTNALLSLIESPNGLKFKNINIFSRTLEQDKYKYLEEILKPIEGLGFYKFTASDDIVAPQKAKPDSIFIFDDVACDKQNAIKAYFCMGRHRGVDCFYLTQTFTRIPKHLIRDNANFIIIFKQDDMNLRHIFDDYSVGCDMKYREFQKLCNICWREKFGFIVIDLDREPNDGRYRKGFDCFIQING